MGSETVVIALFLVACALLGFNWWSAERSLKVHSDADARRITALKLDLADADKRNGMLEMEIQRLRKIPLTQLPEKADTSVIKAKSPAQVRQLTEAAFGRQPEIGEMDS